MARQAGHAGAVSSVHPDAVANANSEGCPAMGTAHVLAVTHLLAATATKKSSSSFSFLLIILVVFAGLYFVMIRPQRNRQRAAQQNQKQADIGARIRTTAGLYGTII
jgi:hypothetical protein